LLCRGRKGGQDVVGRRRADHPEPRVMDVDAAAVHAGAERDVLFGFQPIEQTPADIQAVKAARGQRTISQSVSKSGTVASTRNCSKCEAAMGGPLSPGAFFAAVLLQRHLLPVLHSTGQVSSRPCGTGLDFEFTHGVSSCPEQSVSDSRPRWSSKMSPFSGQYRNCRYQGAPCRDVWCRGRSGRRRTAPIGGCGRTGGP
jgi:hypothetical protein